MIFEGFGPGHNQPGAKRAQPEAARASQARSVYGKQPRVKGFSNLALRAVVTGFAPKY